MATRIIKIINKTIGIISKPAAKPKHPLNKKPNIVNQYPPFLLYNFAQPIERHHMKPSANLRFFKQGVIG